jgi:hypothetical protein
MSGPYVIQAKGAQGPVPPYDSKEKKKMGWFKRWIMRMTQEAIEEDRQIRNSIVATFPSRGFDANGGLNMSVYPADGGYIVQFNHYDHKIDRNFQSLHIIGNDEDFPERISQIITLELIKCGKTT